MPSDNAHIVGGGQAWQKRTRYAWELKTIQMARRTYVAGYLLSKLCRIAPAISCEYNEERTRKEMLSEEYQQLKCTDGFSPQVFGLFPPKSLVFAPEVFS